MGKAEPHKIVLLLSEQGTSRERDCKIVPGAGKATTSMVTLSHDSQKNVGNMRRRKIAVLTTQKDHV